MNSYTWISTPRFRFCIVLARPCPITNCPGYSFFSSSSHPPNTDGIKCALRFTKVLLLRTSTTPLSAWAISAETRLRSLLLRRKASLPTLKIPKALLETEARVGRSPLRVPHCEEGSRKQGRKILSDSIFPRALSVLQHITLGISQGFAQTSLALNSPPIQHCDAIPIYNHYSQFLRFSSQPHLVQIYSS